MERKKPIPVLPRTIGIITSPHGAAIYDILTVLKRRFPAIPIIIYPTTVQGDKAAGQIVKAIEIANQRNECDVIIVSRGGGSIEDLWPFNEEIVAMAIFASIIPIVSGVGHEVDFTIADFVADLRAPTPSAAAEHVVPNFLEWLQQFKHLKNRLTHLQLSHLHRLQVQLTHLHKRLRHPGQRLQEQAQRLDELEHRLLIAIKHDLKHRHAIINRLVLHWQHLNPSIKLERELRHILTIQQRLLLSTQHYLDQKNQRLQQTAAALNVLNPLNTLNRGYAIVYENQTLEVISQIGQIQIGKELLVKMADGSFECVVR